MSLLPLNVVWGACLRASAALFINHPIKPSGKRLLVFKKTDAHQTQGYIMQVIKLQENQGELVTTSKDTACVTLIVGNQAASLFTNAIQSMDKEVDTIVIDGNDVGRVLPVAVIQELFDIWELISCDQELNHCVERLLKRTDSLFTGIKRGPKGKDSRTRYMFEFYDHITEKPRLKTLDSTSPMFQLAVFIGLKAMAKPNSTIFIQGLDFDRKRWANIYNIDALFTYLAHSALLRTSHVVLHTKNISTVKVFNYVKAQQAGTSMGIVMIEGNTPDTCRVLKAAYDESLLLNALLGQAGTHE